ncbi:hypothetical protein HP550_16210 [Cellulomonas humilata]|uniref:Secreted protein n=1 Tax=Cellulomonas humilata TaxID=144055 RepID=A0A7Y6A516_9CELL|nr:hypothetical protein [Cellulomonas humilata]NUU18797.1 hypothetical protein [Cellulomonas humilata]
MTAHRPALARLAVTAALTLGLVTAGATTALAADAVVEPARTDRSATLCARADQLSARLEKALDRIQGDVDRQGSVAWLRARGERASTAGHADLAASLRARADRREARVPEIEDVLDRLASASAEHCGATATPSTP